MKIISTKISYDSITSRFAGVVPSLVDYWEVPEIFHCGDNTNCEKYYSHSLAVKRAAEYNIPPFQLRYGSEFVRFDVKNILEFTKGNYGLIPSDVILPNLKDEEGNDIEITDFTDFYVNLPNGEGGFYDLSWPKKVECTKNNGEKVELILDPHYEGRKIIVGKLLDDCKVEYSEIKVLTYNTLNKWYSFFRKYYELIDGPDYARVYENAIDYYNKEIKVKNNDAKAYYEELDRLFKARGGEEMYKWMTNNCFIQYNIPARFSDEWATTYLTFPDALKWYYWFSERVEKYTHAENLEDCKETDDCCDCNEYIKLGGYEFYKYLRDWVDNFEIDDSYATNSASITIPISFTNSIDDLGEYSIFSNEWKDETDYHNTLANAPGTVVNRPYLTDEETGDKTTLNDTYIISNGITKGYEYNDFYENVFKEDDWGNYTDYYRNHNPQEFASDGITAYTFSPINGKIIYNPGNDVDERITEIIPIKKIDNVCINGLTYEVIDGKYVEMCYSDGSIADLKYRSGKLQVFKDGDLEYVMFNGKRKYVTCDSYGKERVYFLDEYACHDEGCPVSSGRFVIFDNLIYLISESNGANDTLVLDDYDSKRVYPVLDGYFTFKNMTLYISNGIVLVQDDLVYNEDNNTYYYSYKNIGEEELRILDVKKFEIINENEIKVWYRYEIVNCRVVSGYTDTKVELLRRKEISVDDVGNTLPGYFRSVIDLNRIRLVYNGDVIDPTHVKIDGESVTTNSVGFSRYNTPYDECTLDILYRVGEVSDLKPITNIVDEEDNPVNNLFNGNIIESIEFYYRDIYGNKAELLDDEGNLFFANDDNALDVIASCEKAFEEADDENISDVMYCDIKYYIGAVIKKVEENEDWHYELDTNFHRGVMYVDTVYVTKEVGTYYLTDNKSFTFKYYKLSQDIESIYVSDLRASLTWDSSTYFEIQPLLYVYTSNGTTELVDGNIFGKDSNGNVKWSPNNNTMITPIFRREYNLASSYPQNVDSNIYIDRGVNASYEKLLKLQEVRSMEALENLANSSDISGFKINNY